MMLLQCIFSRQFLAWTTQAGGFCKTYTNTALQVQAAIEHSWEKKSQP